MPQEHIEVALATAAQIAPFAPFLVDIGKASIRRISEQISEEMGETAWKQARKLWERLTAGSPEDAELSAAMGLLASNPEDTKRQAMFAEILAKQLKENPDLVEELRELLGEEGSVQEILADRSSWVEDVQQHMQGTGSQRITATDDSVILNAQQTIESD